MKKRIFDISIIVLAVFSIVLLIFKPQICKNGVTVGILLCGRVIIPSLLPFTACVLFIMNSNALTDLKASHPKFGIFLMILLSFTGGYPIGAKLLNSAVEEDYISPKNAGKMLCFCINAGPAFIISAVGGLVLNSKKLGLILALAHIFSGLLLMLISAKGIKFSNKRPNFIKLNLADNFVKSVADASSAVMSICGFVILFSAVNAYINHLAQNFSILKTLGLFLEVTNAVSQTKNIYLISFLLGFGGISVWCQVISVSKGIKIDFLRFIIFRILHGLLSVMLVKIILLFFPLEISVFSNFKQTVFSTFHSSASVGISLLIMSVVFIVSITGKKYVGKILEDVI